jgi:hypothetical protein
VGSFKDSGEINILIESPVASSQADVLVLYRLLCSRFPLHALSLYEFRFE